MNLYLEIIARGILAIYRKDVGVAGLDAVRMDFEKVLLWRVQGKGGIVRDNGRE